MNHYERLGVAPDVGNDELRRAYRDLARTHHPDRNRGDAERATRAMTAINEAYAVLGDPARRLAYDRALGRDTSTPRAASAASAADRGAPRAPRPEDDPVRRAEREAKEREAAAARARGYKPSRRRRFGGMNFRARD